MKPFNSQKTFSSMRTGTLPSRILDCQKFHLAIQRHTAFAALSSKKKNEISEIISILIQLTLNICL